MHLRARTFSSHVASPAIIAALALSSVPANAETLAEYLETCRDELEFQNDPLPDVDCDGANTAIVVTGIEFFGYGKVNDFVDATFICRTAPAGQIPGAVEMLVHNRNTGGTCFFDAKVLARQIPAPTAPNGLVNWSEPSEIDEDPNKLCVTCHTNGPYLASHNTLSGAIGAAEGMARFGLMNDGHDTFADGTPGSYDIPGETFSRWNGLVQDALENVWNDPALSGLAACSASCHAVGANDIVPSTPAFDLLPALEMTLAHMPPARDSVFNWVNLDIPDQAGTGDWETYSQLREYNREFVPCMLPNYVEARVVGSEVTLRTDDFVDALESFDPIDGIVCHNADQNSGMCEDYEVRFTCDDGLNTWETDWLDTDDPNNTSAGDYEPPPADCPATGIRFRVKGSEHVLQGFPDKLYRFDRMGLACLNESQVDGQCENYTVKFVCPENDGTLTLANAQSGTVLTESLPQNGTSYAKGQPLSPQHWASQDWIIEPIDNTPYVRLRSLWTRHYLNVSSQSEGQAVNLHTLVPGWWSEQWEMQAENGGMRFRNRWTGKYLTVDPNPGAPAYRPVSSRSATNASDQVWSMTPEN